MNYTTLYAIRRLLNIGSTVTGDDALLSYFITQGSKVVSGRRRCDIRKQTRPHDYPVKPRSQFGQYDSFAQNSAFDISQGDPRQLRLDDDLLAVVTLLNGDAVEISSTNYILESASIYPKWAITLKNASTVMWVPSSGGDVKQVISVSALWGYHPQYDDAWGDSGDTVENNPLSSSDTSLSVNDADGVDENGEAQRFQAGHLLKIESEFVLITAVNNGTNTLTITRGQNGTTAAAHAQNTVIYIYRPYVNVVRAVERMVVWAYKQKDANVFERISLLGTSTKMTPGAIPEDAMTLLPPKRPMSLRG